MKEVLRTQSLSWAQSVRLALEADGVQAVILDENALGFIGLAGQLRVAVLDDGSVDRARAIIKTLAPPSLPEPLERAWKWQWRGLKTVGAGLAVLFVANAISEGEPRPAAVVLFILGTAAVFAGLVFVFIGFRRSKDSGGAV